MKETTRVWVVAAVVCIVCVAANDSTQKNSDSAISRVFRYFGLGKQAEQGVGSVPYPPNYGPCPLQPSTTTTTTTPSPLVPLCPYPLNAEALPLIGGEGKPHIAPPLYQGHQIIEQPMFPNSNNQFPQFPGNQGGRPPNDVFIQNPGDNQIQGNLPPGFKPEHGRPGFNPEQGRPGFKPDIFRPDLNQPHGNRPNEPLFALNNDEFNQIVGSGQDQQGFNSQNGNNRPVQVRPPFVNEQQQGFSGNRPEQVRPGFNFPNGNLPQPGNFPPNFGNVPNSEKNPGFFNPNPDFGFVPPQFIPNQGNPIFSSNKLPLPVAPDQGFIVQEPSPPKNFLNEHGQGGFRPIQGSGDFNVPKPYIPGVVQNPNKLPFPNRPNEQLNPENPRPVVLKPVPGGISTPVELKPQVYTPTEVQKPNANIPILVESVAHDDHPETPYEAKPEDIEHPEHPVQVKPIVPEQPESPLLIKPDAFGENPEKPLEVNPISPETPLSIKPESPLPELPVAINPQISKPLIPVQNLEHSHFGGNRPTALVPQPVGPNYNIGNQNPFAPNHDSNLQNLIPVDASVFPPNGRPTFGPDGKPIFGQLQTPVFGPDGRPLFLQPQGPGFIPNNNVITIGPNGIPIGPNNVVPLGPVQQPNGKFPLGLYPPPPNDVNIVDPAKPLNSYKCIPPPGPFVPPGFSLVSYPQGICGQAPQQEAPCSMLEMLQKLRLRTFSTLIRLAGLEQLFVDKPNYTLFVPVDVAFELLPRYFLEDLVANKTLLNEFIYSHFAVAEVSLPTLNSETLLRNRRRGINRLRLTVAFPDLDYPSYLVNDAKVLKGDILTTNGRLNIIDKVLKPYPAIDAHTYLASIDDLKDFFHKVEIAGMLDVLQNRDPVTIFVPYNKAFTSMKFDDMDKRAIQNFVKYHMVNGSHYSSALQNNQYLTTNYLKEIKVSVANDGFTKYLSLLNGNIRVLKADITTTNAVIHIIEHCIAEDAPQYIFEDSSEFRFEFGTLRRSMKLTSEESKEEKSSNAK